MKTIDTFGHIDNGFYRTGYEFANYISCYQFTIEFAD